ncbi:MAG TPA: asparagine synthetase A [Candidatus Methanofastidiosa archaeon]|nr:asparagine synthetase A [Candidatus Methanofastidiosa archaeon]HPR42397.1 asparagine synthetase A [Candidatus Methanofastidiosa archaeon]
MSTSELKAKLGDYHTRLSSRELQIAMKVNTHVRRYLGDYLFKEGFTEIPPVILSPMTDPLNHPTLDPVFSCYGHRYQLTKSMIFHKQLALLNQTKIFCFSPNLRFEPLERAQSGRHLFEFTQLDIEMRDASREDAMILMEGMYTGLISYCKKELAAELSELGRDLKVPTAPFGKVSYLDAAEKYGEKFESELSKDAKDPVWIIDIPLAEREFYDFEDPTKEGILRDMDMIYPEGFGEASSGGEREYEYERIVERIHKKEQDVNDFEILLEMASKGLYASAGFGIGIERLVRYICGFSRIEAAAMFPKIPGELCI